VVRIGHVQSSRTVPCVAIVRRRECEARIICHKVSRRLSHALSPKHGTISPRTGHTVAAAPPERAPPKLAVHPGMFVGGAINSWRPGPFCGCHNGPFARRATNSPGHGEIARSEPGTFALAPTFPSWPSTAKKTTAQKPYRGRV